MSIQAELPTVGPVTLQEAKHHLRVVSDDDDAYIAGLILAALNVAEDFTGRAIVRREFVYRLNAFQSEIVLPMPPVAEVVSVEYVDMDGATQTFTDWQADLNHAFMPAIKPAFGESWPVARPQYDAVTITYRAGYGSDAESPQTGDHIPHAIKQAVLLLVGTMYEFREQIVAGVTATEIPLTAQRLLDPYRVRRIA